MPKIENLTSIQVLDSRGLPTISTEIQLDDGTRSVAMVPSGASTGEKEALELRDGGEAFHGKGVKKALDNIGLDRFGTPEEVAELTYFLCDPKMRHLTGTEINLDGGKKTTI